MKKLFMLAAAALLTFGMVSCDKNDETTNNDTTTTTTTGGGTDQGTDTGNDQGTDPGNANPWANPNPGTTSGEWVDLGLPSGLLWYSVNLGAAAPEHYGDYYAWGETKTKEDYSWGTYAYGSASNQLTKYCNDSEYGLDGYTDNLTTLQSSDDAATAVIGKGARIPTKDEWQELFDNTTFEWTTVNGVYGRMQTATNGKSLFLPAAGVRIYSGALGSAGDYWSASLGEDGPYHAWHVNFHYNYHCVNGYERYYGLSVRAVCPKN